MIELAIPALTKEPKMTTPTLKDVAATAGVSVSSASRALHGSVGGVSQDTRRRVQMAAEQLGYVRTRAPYGTGTQHRQQVAAAAATTKAARTSWQRQLAAQLLALATQRRQILAAGKPLGAPKRAGIEVEATLLEQLAALAKGGRFPATDQLSRHQPAREDAARG